MLIKSKKIRERLASGDVDLECTICIDMTTRDEALVTQCGHVFCKQCLIHHVDHKIMFGGHRVSQGALAAAMFKESQ